jgi:hypothetical protein
VTVEKGRPFMKRIAASLALALVVSIVAGCGGGGIEEGISTEDATPTGQPAGFEDMMKKNAENMKMQRPKATPKAR